MGAEDGSMPSFEEIVRGLNLEVPEEEVIEQPCAISVILSQLENDEDGVPHADIETIRDASITEATGSLPDGNTWFLRCARCALNFSVTKESDNSGSLNIDPYAANLTCTVISLAGHAIANRFQDPM